MDLEDVARQRFVAGVHTANRPGSEHAVVARREKPAVQRLSEDPAYRRDPETASVLVDVRGHQRRVGSSRAAKNSRRRHQNLVRLPQLRDLGPKTLELRHRVLG